MFLYPRRTISVGSDLTTRSWACCVSSSPAFSDLRFEMAPLLFDAAAWLLIQSPKTLSAAVRVGLSRFAGVPVLDLARRVDLPKEPVSGTARRDRVVPGWPSCL